MDNDITVTMSAKEFELTLNALAQLPFAQVSNLLGKLVAQANARTDGGQENLNLTPEGIVPSAS